MILYLKAKSDIPDLAVDFIEVKLKSGQVISLTWDESEFDREDGQFEARYKGVCFDDAYYSTSNSVKENREPILMASVHPHAIRRTFCTRCFEANINPKAVQKLMGHATYSTTIDIYTTVMKDRMDYEIDKFELGYAES